MLGSTELAEFVQGPVRPQALRVEIIQTRRLILCQKGPGASRKELAERARESGEGAVGGGRDSDGGVD